MPITLREFIQLIHDENDIIVNGINPGDMPSGLRTNQISNWVLDRLAERIRELLIERGEVSNTRSEERRSRSDRDSSSTDRVILTEEDMSRHRRNAVESMEDSIDSIDRAMGHTTTNTTREE